MIELMQTSKHTLGTAIACVVVLGSIASDAGAQAAATVAVVINTASPASQRIGEYYSRKRALPASNILRIRTSAKESIPRAEYEQ